MAATDREHISSEDLEANIRRKHAAYMHELERIEDKGSDRALILSGGISALEDLRPELKESKGEKIRKEMIKYFTNGKEYLSLTSYSREDYIAWLEEQGEHNMGISEATKKELENNLNKALEKETPESWNEFLEKQGEQKPAEWSEIEPIIQHLDNLGNTAMADILRSFQPQQEWSEEDEELLHDVSDTYFYNDEDYPEETYKQMLKRVLDWMNKRAKSLRPQSHWKPSDEQIKAVKEAACYSSVFSENTIDNLISLSKQLKKLKE